MNTNLSIWTWNANTDRRQTGNIADAIPECLMERRFPYICAEVKRRLSQGGVFVLFEIVDDVCAKFAQFGKDNGWSAVSAKYNQSHGSFNYLVLANNVEIMASKLLPLTKSGKPYEGDRDNSVAHKTETLNEEFEKGVFQVTLSDLTLFVVHLGLRNDSRLLQMAKLQEYVAGADRAIILGDFNSFDATKKEPTLFAAQFDDLKSSGWTHATNNIVSTFDNRSFPYDLVFKMSNEDKALFDDLSKSYDIPQFREFLLRLPERYSTVGVALDHAFTKGLDCTASAEALPALSDHSIIQVVVNL